MIARPRFICVWLLLATTWGVLRLRAPDPIPPVRHLADVPPACREWRMVSQTRFNAALLSVLKPTDYLYRKYARPEGESVDVYVGYHDGGEDGGQVHSPRHCLPGNGWQEEKSGRIDLRLPAGTVRLTRSVYRRGEERELFLYWYQAEGRSYADVYSLKLAELTNALLLGRRDTAFIRVSLPLGHDERGAEAAGVGFVRGFYPIIRDFLPS